MQAQAEMGQANAPDPAKSRQLPWRRILGVAGLVLAIAFFATALVAYLVDQAVHRNLVLFWYDLNVYNDAGLIARQMPSILYTWELKPGIQFTYTPFAAIVFAGGSLLPYAVLRWTMTVASLLAIPLTVWLTLGAMGRRGVGRAGVTLAVSALALWTEPVIKALYLGQIEPLLMLLVVWDLTRRDGRWWKGTGIGIAAGMKLVPLIFIPYLLLAGKIRQAVVATITFAVMVVIGFIVLPGPSASYWLTGYFMRPGRTGGVDSLVNQSLLGALTRQYLDVTKAQIVWLPLAIVVAALGLIGGAMLTRAGKPVPGWTLVGVTSVLVSPISWDHHWVWIVPFLALLGGLAMTKRLWARAGYIALIVLTAGVMGSWPWRYSGSQAFVPRRGLLGWFVKPPQVTEIVPLHGWQLLTWNLWVTVGALIYLALLAAAWPVWRKRPLRPVTATQSQSPFEALLARADAVLRAGGAPKVQDGASSAPLRSDRTAAQAPGLSPAPVPADADGRADAGLLAAANHLTTVAGRAAADGLGEASAPAHTNGLAAAGGTADANGADANGPADAHGSGSGGQAGAPGTELPGPVVAPPAGPQEPGPEKVPDPARASDPSDVRDPGHVHSQL